MKTKALLVLIFCYFICLGIIHADNEVVKACVNPDLVDQKLAWSAQSNSWCGGSFLPISVNFQQGFSLKADQMDLTAQGQSKLKGHVLVHHHYQQLSADLATVCRDNHGVVKQIRLNGNVVVEHPQARLAAQQVVLYLPGKRGKLEAVTYRYTLAPQSSVPKGVTAGLPRERSLTIWGQACRVERDKAGNLQLHNVTYTACPPHQVTWHLEAKELDLDLAQARATARSAALYWHSHRLFRIPYIDFPFEAQRKSGFLLTHLIYSSQNGWDYQQPYYLNLAPNFDLTLLPHYFSKRGVMIGGQFRYLTALSEGQVEAHFLSRDRAFIQFKDSNLINDPNLAALDNHRYSLQWQNQSHLDEHLTLDVDYQKVSDDYYLQDFNDNLVEYTNNQLRQALSLKYQPPHLQFELLLQRFQTLHPFNQSRVADTYGLMPSVALNMQSPPMPYGLYANMAAQAQRFVWYGQQQDITPEGYRYAFHPQVGFYLEDASTVFHPSLGVHATYYDLQHYNSQHQSLSRLIPDASFDLQRYHFTGGGKDWFQVWESRIHYLYIPYVSQSAVPVFDTAYFFPSYDRLFRDNRFVGGDRVGDANQVSFGLSSRLMQSANGFQRLQISVGGGYQLRQPRVMLCQNWQVGSCADDASELAYATNDSRWLPWQLEANLAFNRRVSLVSSVGLSGNSRQLSNSIINLRYQTQPNHIVELGYGFLVNGDPIVLDSVSPSLRDLHQLRMAYTWPFRQHWHSLGAWSYNIAHKFSMSYLFGVEYDDCCVGFRLLAGRVYRYYSPQGHPVYGNNVYVQILLKGLGSGANEDPTTILQNFLPTLDDRFRRRY